MKPTVDVLKALADRNRLRVVAALMRQEELCACQLVELLRVTGATASRHMELLIRAGLVNGRKEGRWVYYRLEADFPELLFQWLEGAFQSEAEIKDDGRKLDKIVACLPQELCRKQRTKQ